MPSDDRVEKPSALMIFFETVLVRRPFPGTAARQRT